MPDARTLTRTALAPVAGPAARGRARVLAAVGSGVVRAASLVRGERIIHAEGTALQARFIVPGGAGVGVPLLDEPGTWPALVRFSRGAGLPDRLPDVLGVAVRVLDAHGPDRPQDLLLASSRLLPLVRHVPVPQYDLLGTAYTSITPYELAGRRRLLWLLPDPGAPETRSVDDLPGRCDGTRLRLAVSSSRGRPHEVAVLELGGVAAAGRPREVAVLELGGVAAAGRQVRFSPDVTGGGIRPVGWLQDLRRDAYRAAHVGPDR